LLSRALRLLAAALGGYAFAAGLVAVVAAASPRLGMAATESATLGGLLGVPACLAILIWVVASTRPVRTVIIVLAASAIMIGTAPMMVTG
jgi:hypothetical protein